MATASRRDRIATAIRAKLDEQSWMDDALDLRAITVTVRLNEYGRPCQVNMRPEMESAV